MMSTISRCFLTLSLCLKSKTGERERNGVHSGKDRIILRDEEERGHRMKERKEEQVTKSLPQ